MTTVTAQWLISAQVVPRRGPIEFKMDFDVTLPVPIQRTFVDEPPLNDNWPLPWTQLEAVPCRAGMDEGERWDARSLLAVLERTEQRFSREA